MQFEIYNKKDIEINIFNIKKKIAKNTPSLVRDMSLKYPSSNFLYDETFCYLTFRIKLTFQDDVIVSENLLKGECGP